jgi:hypothetical protein
MATNTSSYHYEAAQSLDMRATLCDSTVEDGCVEDKGMERLLVHESRAPPLFT